MDTFRLVYLVSTKWFVDVIYFLNFTSDMVGLLGISKTSNAEMLCLKCMFQYPFYFYVSLN